MTPYQQRARAIIADALTLTGYDTMASEELASLAELLVCAYMNSYIDGGTLYEDSDFGDTLRRLADTIRSRHTSAADSRLAEALFDISRTGEIEPVSATVGVTSVHQATPATSLRAEYNKKVCAPGYAPNDADTSYFIANVQRMLAEHDLTLSDRLALYYVEYSVMADVEELGI